MSAAARLFSAALQRGCAKKRSRNSGSAVSSVTAMLRLRWQIEVAARARLQRKASGSRALPEVARMVNTRQVKSSLARCEGTLSAERHGQDALVLGGVGAGRTQAHGLAERDRLPLERGLDARVLHINREPEASHRIPVGDGTNGPVVEAGVAFDAGPDPDVLVRSARTGVTAEQATADHVVVVPDLRVGPVHRSREVGQPEVLPARARRPSRRQLELAAIDEDAIGDHAQRNRVATAEQAGAAQVAAACIGSRADAVVEVATEVIAGAGPGRLDVDA